jgi:hypothetical protein
MSTQNPQSWFDLPMVEPMDPRAIIQAITLDDDTGASIIPLFMRSTDFIKNTTWATSPLGLSNPATRIPQVLAVNNSDYEAEYVARDWNATHGMVRSNMQLPPTVAKIVFAKAGNRFTNVFWVDWSGASNSTDVQLSFRDNSATSGDFTNASSGSVPVFAWSGSTFSGTGKRLQITFTRPGRFSLVLRVIDGTGSWSMFELEVNVLA